MDFNSTNVTDINTTEYHDSGFSNDAYIHFTIAAAVAIALCLFGMVGNVIVFWYLSLKIKRNKYTVYIINLAAADLIFLIFTAVIMMVNINTMVGKNPEFTGKQKLLTALEIVYDSALYSGMFFLTAISMERCFSAVFPMWYQCYRPKNLSLIACFLLWIIAWLEALLENLVCPSEDFDAQTTSCTGVELMIFITGIGLCLPLMVLSSITLMIMVKRTFQLNCTPRLYIIIIIAVIIFVLSVIPFQFVWFMLYFQLLPLDVQYVSIYFASVFGTVLNSIINPYIYFIVGRQWKEKSLHSIQDALKRAFKDDKKENPSSNKAKTSSCQTNLPDSA
ncbi:mas-related G-protein coupled receptor member D-like [Spea bombifrons]|uniref:mas-related G-protein coupled receptor member D-like n=1 Tax=Spea bombifrons TaxID=233779 RepID=UPI0023491192|nr:mas-related G-protein coupled receptor member D-like [Spea bombifrons]